MIYEHIPGGHSINIIIANEHVPDIECQIIVIKDRTRAIRHSLSFNNIPNLITIYIFFTFFIMINYLPVKGGVSTIISPNTIISGETLRYKRRLGISIG